MINKIEIKNFKSIVDLKMDLGRINVIIGANGCGKTNILESFAFASAASQKKLDNEYLLARGIRIPGPQFVIPAFEDLEETEYDKIAISIFEGVSIRDIEVKFNKDSKKWEDASIVDVDRSIIELLNNLLDIYAKQKGLGKIEYRDKDSEHVKGFLIEVLQKAISDKFPDFNPDMIPKLFDALYNNKSLPTFLIFSPDEIVLREQNTESPIKPLGIHGEGLFSFLKEQMNNEKSLFEKLNEGLNLLDWFDGLDVPKDLLSNEAKLLIGDRYLKESLHFFDQRSTNEGFLYLLFYLTLFNSKETPSFFAVDNIEASFNPKLCMRLIRLLIELAKENDKQVILTTHSPFVLDALDLKDDEQRLFVARRDIDGHTRATRIKHKAERTKKLSEVWMNGYIGGLPDNF
ncbi:AAA family ATPase [Phocaeicola barnesiae]|uniref:AAA family ATPase n=1 Tax=Phocaeicola barnesiae TaxID=376804 RepID=UPI0025A43E3E|nr:ATP-binding protein [Phocaeicola barnesiae]MDM8250774.1 AAA family ATPase [Phocaeicola barnesiae]MDM8254602.1 AAA family ATPase [Phocaeicola barnesiae]MDM8257758.1 AAA family ATPase [Phocaeicola barnesiae]